MIAVIPYTSKILEPCQNFLAYRPPNPWTVVLFKNLGVDMKVVKPTSLLKDRARESQGNPDFSMKDMGASQLQLITETNTGIVSTFNAVDLQPDIISSTQPGAHLNLLSQDEKMATLSLSDRLASGQGLPQVPPSQSQYSVGQLSSPIHDIGSHIIFNQKLSALGLQYFERSVPLAIKRAIEEVMDHVVQHNVTIATQTTKELVLKDYAMESDETPIYNAAHLMVASLAGSLAHVTCKASNISSELQEQAVAIIMNDNLDLCCAVIQHATTDNVNLFGFPRKICLVRFQLQFLWLCQFHLLILLVPVCRTYVSFAGKLSLGFSSSGMGSLGSGSIAQSVDRISKEVDPSSAGLLSGSTHNVATDGTIQSCVEVSNAALNSSPATVLEPRVLENSNTMKGVIAQVLEIILRCISRDEAALAVAQKDEHDALISLPWA